MNDYLALFLFAVISNIFMFIPAFIMQTDKLTDISYGVSFALLGVFAFLRSEKNIAHYLLFAAVLAWSLRISIFLFVRIRKMGKDARFDGMRNKFFAFLRFWLVQGVTVFVVMTCALVVFSNKAEGLSMLSIAGLALFIAGLLTEATADLEKYRFNNDKKNYGKWIDIGLWRKTRHPNYLGEMSVWAGVYIFALPFLSGWQFLIALVSPAYIICLISFVSGIPLLEKSADAKWGKDEAYQKYKKEVPVLIPSIKSIKR